jgi:hypothetical protein
MLCHCDWSCGGNVPGLDGVIDGTETVGVGALAAPADCGATLSVDVTGAAGSEPGELGIKLGAVIAGGGAATGNAPGGAFGVAGFIRTGTGLELGDMAGTMPAAPAVPLAGPVLPI